MTTNPNKRVVSRKEAALLIRGAASRYYTHKKWAVNYEMGLNRRGRLRADVLAFNFRGEIVIVEVKSCPADFFNDTKWTGYLPFSNKTYFAVGPKTWLKIKGHVPKGIGVMVCSNPTTIKVVQNAAHRPVDPEVQFNLMMRMAFRAADAVKRPRKSKVIYEDN